MKMIEDLSLGLQEVHIGLDEVVIYYGDKLLTSYERYDGNRPTSILVHKQQHVILFIVTSL